MLATIFFVKIILSMRYYICFVFSILGISCSNKKAKEPKPNEEIIKGSTSMINYALVKTYPHDTTSFTEGFFIHNNLLFESTGSPDELPFTKSHFGILDTANGIIAVKATLDNSKYFGEGIALLNDKIYQLTYKNNICFVYDGSTYKKINEFTYKNKEGWGLTTDGTQLIMSDGTHSLTFISPQNFSVVKKIDAFDNLGKVELLNELEYVNGFIYANIYGTHKIAKINTTSGEVTGYLDCTSLLQDAATKHKTLLEMNGIAYHPTKKTFYVTGKMWPKVYEISFAH
jgi:glutamine cyclotransferase